MYYALALVVCACVGLSAGGDTPILPVPTVCPKENPMEYTVHLAHESDCTKFYKCDWGEKVLFDCPKPLYFNAILQVCDWTCVSAPAPEPTTETSPETTTETTPEPTTETETQQPPRDPDCPWPDPLDHTVHLPHDTDCSKFYKCNHGHKEVFDCPKPLLFNPKWEVCDWPENVDCGASPHPHPHPTPQTTPEPETQTPLEPLDPDCPWPDPLNYTVHLPHETDCSKFYKCNHGHKEVFDCPKPLMFNPILEVCDWQNNVNCNGGEVPTTPEIEPETLPSLCEGEGGHIPHECDCTKYYKCVEGVKILYECVGGSHFGVKTLKCEIGACLI